MASVIHVCQARSCNNAGAESVLCEIEELASMVEEGNCQATRSGCLGYCSRAPAVYVEKEGGDSFVKKRVNSFQKFWISWKRPQAKN